VKISTARYAAICAFAILASSSCDRLDEHEGIAATAQQALNLSPGAGNFVLYATNSQSIGDRSVVAGGDVGVQLAGTGPFLVPGYELSLSSGAQVGTTQTLLADSILLSASAVVGDVQTNQLTNQGATRGQLASMPPMPAFPAVSAVTAGTANLVVNSGTTTTIGSGKYGTVTVNGRLTLTGGVVQTGALILGPDARIEVTASSELRVVGQLSMADRAYLGPAGTTTLGAGALRLEVSGVNGNGGLSTWSCAMAVGNNATLRALVLVPNGTARIGQRTQFRGALFARDILVDLDAKVTYEQGFSNATCSPADCSDDNACTSDTCVAGVC
jgi:hypothetical protein